MTLRRASTADLPFIQMIAGRTENHGFIANETTAVLQSYLETPLKGVVIWEQNGRSEGFCIYDDVTNTSRTISLKRLALDCPASGLGRVFIADLISYGFETLGAAKLWLDVVTDNPRAQHAYARAGFQSEGLLRSHLQLPNGQRVDLVQMGLLREDWAN